MSHMIRIHVLLRPGRGLLCRLPPAHRRGPDMHQFEEQYSLRITDKAIKIPRAIDAWFARPAGAEQMRLPLDPPASAREVPDAVVAERHHVRRLVLHLVVPCEVDDAAAVENTDMRRPDGRAKQNEAGVHWSR